MGSLLRKTGMAMGAMSLIAVGVVASGLVYAEVTKKMLKRNPTWMGAKQVKKHNSMLDERRLCMGSGKSFSGLDVVIDGHIIDDDGSIRLPGAFRVAKNNGRLPESINIGAYDKFGSKLCVFSADSFKEGSHGVFHFDATSCDSAGLCLDDLFGYKVDFVDWGIGSKYVMSLA